MKKPFVIGFYGYSNSGKTSIIIKLIKRLSDKSFKVATIKNSDKKIVFDKQEKDTYRHAQSGAESVVLSSHSETDFIIKKKLAFDEIVNYLSMFGEKDIIIVEGANDEITPKIRIGSISERHNTIFTYDNDFEKLYEFIEKNIKQRGVKS